MNALMYKGYAACIDFDAEDRIFTGRLAGIDDIVVFHGSTVEELETAFHESVDHYLEVSERTGRPAKKPFSGKLILTVPPELHAAIAVAAQVSGKSINQWTSETLNKATTTF
mgnify:CR=1 FL=1